MKKIFKRKPVTAALSLALAVVLTACSSPAEGNPVNTDLKDVSLTGTQKWVDSDLTGAIEADKEYRLQDDFAAAVNKEWKLSVGDRYRGTFEDVVQAVYAKKKQAATDPSITGPAADVLRSYYSLATDWDYRNSQGIEPLKPYLKYIESIGSVEELYAYFMDPQRNPLCAGPVHFRVETGIHAQCYPDGYVLFVYPAVLSLSDGQGNSHYADLEQASSLDLYEQMEAKAHYILKKAGYSEEDARRIYSNCLKWEKKAAFNDDSKAKSDVEDHMVDMDKALSLAGKFPLKDLMKAWGVEKSGKVSIAPGYAKSLASLCSKSQLQNIKDYLIVYYCLESADYLDREIMDTFSDLGVSKSEKKVDTGMSKEQLEDELIFDEYITGTAMIGAMDQIYVGYFFDDSVTGELTSMTEDVIDALKVIFENEEWLTDEGKKVCVEKLSAVGIHIAHPSSDVVDYSKMNFPSREEGGSFLEAVYETRRFMTGYNDYLSTKKYDKDFWDPLNEEMNTTMTNAFYNPSTNGIYICAGICEPPAYSPELSYEEKLAGLFNIVGHEITHGFDKNGSQYDKDGMKNDWLPYKDALSFSDRNDKVAEYYSTLKPYSGADIYAGSRVSGEATADMGGFRATLYIASRKPGFDYDLYFRSVANLYKENVPLDVEKVYFASDVHPLDFYRVNVGLQQFEKFHEFYGIKEGDGMYLAPEKRIAVW